MSDEMKSYLRRRYKENPHSPVIPEILHQCYIFEKRVKELEDLVLQLRMKVNNLEHASIPNRAD